MNTPRLAPGVLIEQVGDDVLVVTHDSLTTLRLTGEAATVAYRVQAGQPIELNSPVVRDLAERGIITLPGMSRRGLIKAGAIGAGAGIAVMAMPGVAAASSEPAVITLIGYWDNTPTPNIQIGVWDNTGKFPNMAGKASNSIQISVTGQSSSFTSTSVSTSLIVFASLSPDPVFSGVLSGSMIIDGVTYSVTINPPSP